MAKVTYYSRVEGSTFYAPDGVCHTFLGKPAAIELDTLTDKAVINELDGLIKSSRGAVIFKDAAADAPDMLDAIKDAQQAAVNAAQAAAASAKVAGV